MYNERMNAGEFAKLHNRRVCVALSGGGDSVALLHILQEAASSCGIALSAVHVEHGIRGESSAGDAEFVRRLCEEQGVPLRVYAKDVPRLAREWGIGIEDAARRVRYEIFLGILSEDFADVIATAHHAGDNAESVLFNLFRGSAMTGAGGIRSWIAAEELAERFGVTAEPLRDKWIVRPLLGVPKSEIEEYLRKNGLQWREDESNADTSYARNFLRREIMDKVRTRFAEADRSLYRFSRLAREDDDYLYSLTDAYYTEGERCIIAESAPKPLFYRCIVRALKHLGAEKDYTLENLDGVYGLLAGENGKTVHLPCGIRAAREYGKICLFREAEAERKEYAFGEGEFAFSGRIAAVYRGKREEKGALYADAAKFPSDCVIRLRREGDVFRKFGSGTKKLKEFFIDKKIPKRERDRLPVIACGKEVFAVFGAEISDKVRLDGGSEQIYTLILYEEGEEKCTRT